MKDKLQTSREQFYTMVKYEAFRLFQAMETARRWNDWINARNRLLVASRENPDTEEVRKLANQLWLERKDRDAASDWSFAETTVARGFTY